MSGLGARRRPRSCCGLDAATSGLLASSGHAAAGEKPGFPQHPGSEVEFLGVRSGRGLLDHCATRGAGGATAFLAVSERSSWRQPASRTLPPVTMLYGSRVVNRASRLLPKAASE